MRIRSARDIVTESVCEPALKFTDSTASRLSS
jgi:hypothetical protein